MRCVDCCSALEKVLLQVIDLGFFGDKQFAQGSRRTYDYQSNKPTSNTSFQCSIIMLLLFFLSKNLHVGLPDRKTPKVFVADREILNW